MVAHQLNSSGECTTCKTKAIDEHILKCYDCKSHYHTICGEDTPYGCKTFVCNFSKLKAGKKISNFLFVCDHCLTKRENDEASDLKDQLSELTSTVNKLATEFSAFKSDYATLPLQKEAEVAASPSPWKNQKRTREMKASLCIKSKGTPVDMNKIQEIASSNSIQISKANVKDNGDVYVDMPSNENREKLHSLLENETFAENEVVKLKSKLPTISVLGV